MSDEVCLELVVQEKKEGVLVTNIERLETLVAEKLKEYTPEQYTGDAAAAKKDRAVLNASKKTLAGERIRIIKELMKPFEDFEARCKKLEGNIDLAAKALDEIVKAREDAEKALKLARIKEFWGVQNFDLVPLEKVFDQRWLNKTVKDKDVFEEIEKKIATIYENIKTIEAFGVDVDILKPIYLDTLDLGKTIEQGNRLKANRERLAKEEAERWEREEARTRREAQEALARDEVAAQTNAPAENLAAQALGDTPETDPMDEFRCVFRGRRSALFAMGQYMIDNGITYEKLEG
jgi:hypothetical protein